MKNRKLRLGLTLALLGCLASGATAQRTAAETPEQQGVSSAALARIARGTWDLPGPGLPGDMTGRLLRRGRAVYELDALLRRDPSGPGGSILGVARVLRGPNAGQLRTVRGSWAGNGQGQGKFRLVILRPAPAAGTPTPAVEVQGVFQDANGPFLPGGAFQGTWERK